MIDQKIIDVHQWVVDESERHPRWWVEQTALAFIATGLVSAIVSWDGPWSIMGAATTLALGTFLIVCARRRVTLEKLGNGSAMTRGIFLAFWAFDLARFALDPSVKLGARLLAGTVLVSCYYFAACQPPRPRKPRQVARTSHASA